MSDLETTPGILPPVDTLPVEHLQRAERTVRRYCPDDADMVLEALGLRDYPRNALRIGHK